jgi:hypothetical protein
MTYCVLKYGEESLSGLTFLFTAINIECENGAFAGFFSVFRLV